MSTHRLLVTVAHPDDESFGCGSLLAHATSRGVPATVCCATRGEAGEVTGPRSPEEVAELREAELRKAALLGVQDVRVPGWRDSGMAGDPAPESLVAAPMVEVVAMVTALLEELQPTVVVTLDAGDGHRDHAKIRDATIEAVATASWQVERLYLSCLPQSLMRQWVDRIKLTTPESEHLSLAALAELGTPDEEITTVVDTSAHYDLRWQAIAAHASQGSPYDSLPPDLQRAFLATDRLQRLRPVWSGEPLETDFLA